MIRTFQKKNIKSSRRLSEIVIYSYYFNDDPTLVYGVS